jgi:hypothetical protein
MRDELSPALIRQGLRTRFVGQDVTYLRTVDSTNVVAARAASRGAAEGLLVIAEEQTAGRGRLGRRWISPPGVGLWFSVVLRPAGLPPTSMGRLLMLTGCAVARAIERVARLSAWLKWPNDVLVNGRKVGGLLGQAGLPLPSGGVAHARSAPPLRGTKTPLPRREGLGEGRVLDTGSTLTPALSLVGRGGRLRWGAIYGVVVAHARGGRPPLRGTKGQAAGWSQTGRGVRRCWYKVNNGHS